jgi:DNA-binding transcriptional regulator YdaS (Cro superfamily)
MSSRVLRVPDHVKNEPQRLLFLVRLAALHATGGGTLPALANRIGRWDGYFRPLVVGREFTLSAELAIKIEEASDGAVTRQDLLPAIFN